MAEEEKAEEQLLEAIKRVAALPWKKTRDSILWKSLQWHCQALGLEIVRIDPPVEPKSDNPKP